MADLTEAEMQVLARAVALANSFANGKFDSEAGDKLVRAVRLNAGELSQRAVSAVNGARAGMLIETLT